MPWERIYTTKRIFPIDLTIYRIARSPPYSGSGTGIARRSFGKTLRFVV